MEQKKLFVEIKAAGTENERMPVPSVVKEGGVSTDYRNEVPNLDYASSLVDDDEDFFVEASEVIKDVLSKGGAFMRTYRQRFPDSKYLTVVTEENRSAVDALDAIAVEVNERFAADDIKTIVSNAEASPEDMTTLKEFVAYMVDVQKRVSTILD